MLETSRTNGICTIRMAHGKANALDVELLEGLRKELRSASDAGAIVLTGNGSIFCAGVDLFRLTSGEAGYVQRFFPALCAFLRELFEIPVPVVVAANGHAIAGGALIVLAADYRLMAKGNGRIGIPELLVGVPFPAVALEVVRFAVSGDRVQSLVYTGRNLLVEEALHSGLVDEFVEPDALPARAQAIAEQLARIPREHFVAVKQSLRGPFIERMDRESARTDAATLQSWSSPTTHTRIRDYLQTIGRK